MFGNKGGALFDTDDIDPEDYKRCMMQGKSQTGGDFEIQRVGYTVLSANYSTRKYFSSDNTTGLCYFAFENEHYIM
jgi:hypothetical protein